MSFNEDFDQEEFDREYKALHDEFPNIKFSICLGEDSNGRKLIDFDRVVSTESVLAIKFDHKCYCYGWDMEKNPEKYIDTVNHYNETIEILTASGQKVIICDLDNSGLYRYCQVGDSIVKQPDTYIIDVYRDGDGKASFEIFINLLD